jgi:hypothetical protein
MVEAKEQESFDAPNAVTDAVKTVISEGKEAEKARKEEIKKKRDEVEIMSFRLDKDQKEHLITYLLKQNKELYLSVVETVLGYWVTTLTDDEMKTSVKQRRKTDYARRLEWVREYFGTKFMREGQERFRTAKLSTVIGYLVKFCLSAGDRDKTQPADLGLFAETAHPKTGEALLGLSSEGQGVSITEAGYNQTQALLRKLLENFGDLELEGRKLTDLVVEVQSGLKQVGKAGPLLPNERGVKTFTEQEKKQPERRSAYDSAKAEVFSKK